MERFIVSARKYRPNTFDTVIGQHTITVTLKNAIKIQHLAHAYLFCGPRGVGKTTCARIFAKTIPNGLVKIRAIDAMVTVVTRSLEKLSLFAAEARPAAKSKPSVKSTYNDWNLKSNGNTDRIHNPSRIAYFFQSFHFQASQIFR